MNRTSVIKSLTICLPKIGAMTLTSPSGRSMSPGGQCHLHPLGAPAKGICTCSEHLHLQVAPIILGAHVKCTCWGYLQRERAPAKGICTCQGHLHLQVAPIRLGARVKGTCTCSGYLQRVRVPATVKAPAEGKRKVTKERDVKILFKNYVSTQ